MTKPVIIGNATLFQGDCLDVLATLPDNSVHCCVTSPPYFGLRDYGHPDQIGLEASPDAYVTKMVSVFREVRRVLRDDGTCFVNIGDSYNAAGRTGHGTRIGYKQGTNRASASGADNCRPSVDGLKEKDLIGIPWLLAFALRADGWYLRSEIIWAKKNCMPESVTDRPTKAHEQVFLLTKSARYWYDAEAAKEAASETSGFAMQRAKGVNTWKYNDTPERISQTGQRVESSTLGVYGQRNRRSVWSIASQPFTGDWKTSHQVDVELGAVSCGTKRIASSSCPVHGLLDHPGSIHECGEHEADDLNRIARIYGQQVQAQSPDVLAVDANIGTCCQGDSQDCQPLAYAQTAIVHNTQNHKTVLYPGTSQPCMPCAGTACCTDDTPNQRDYVAPDRCIPANNTLISDEAACHLPDQTADDNSYIHASETPVCTCRFFNEVTKSISHFAVMPKKLVEPCILAGCPEQCCPVCGQGWKQQVERTSEPDTTAKGSTFDGGKTGARDGGDRTQPGARFKTRTLGHRPSCQCGASHSIPGTVLDPFNGAATVGVVALEHGRQYLGIELNPEYVQLSVDRLRDATRQGQLFTLPPAHLPPVTTPTASQASLFVEAA